MDIKLPLREDEKLRYLVGSATTERLSDVLDRIELHLFGSISKPRLCRGGCGAVDHCFNPENLCWHYNENKAHYCSEGCSVVGRPLKLGVDND